MTKKISSDQLSVGMFVEIPLSWDKHPFFKNRFKLKNNKQIEKIRQSGIKYVNVIAELSDPHVSSLITSANEDSETAVPPQQECQEAPVPGEWNPANLAPIELLEALDDDKMSSNEKAQAIFNHSRTMMERLFESPSAENILTSKKVVSSITDLVLSDDDTAGNLLRITSHDFYTYTHSVNVGITALLLAKALFRGSDGHDLHELGAGFFLHDLGKVMIDSEVINKPGRLSESEMARMRTHPYQGFKILQQAEALSPECKYIVMQHHEHSDGSGYPRQLKGDEIHRYAKICAIADVYDALTAERSYKKAMRPFEALKLMQDKMSDHFDRKLFNEFVLLFSK